MNARKVAIGVTPLATMLALAAGLGVGASERARAAIVRGAPLSAGSHALVWQIATLADDHGIREALAVPDLVVTAERVGARAEWRGASNTDGIAEARLELPGLREGDDVRLEVRGAGELLAAGRVAWGAARRSPPGAAWARATRVEGPVRLDVTAIGGRLAAEEPGALWVRATDAATGAPLAGTRITVEPEPGLEVPTPTARTCDGGWAEIRATATYHLVGASFHAEKDGREGLWYGAVPIAAGAARAALPMRVDPDHTRAILVDAAATRGPLYAEIDDGEGRAAAAALTAPRGAIELPPLADGLYWLVTSSEPAGAEAIDGATLARPFFVARASGASAAPRDPCATGAALAQASAAGFPRWIALDGLAERRAAARARGRLGVAIGLSALALGALLEVLLVVGSARRGREDLAPSLVKRAPAGSVAIAVLATLLGFALLAALLVYRAG